MSTGHVTAGAAESPVISDPNLPLEMGSASNRPVDASNEAVARLIAPESIHPESIAGPPPPSAMQMWLHRTSVFLFVLISAIAGVLLVILPWVPEWTDNYLLLSFPWLRPIVSAGFFRGLCSGLGLLDIWIGFWEALHYHDHR